MTDRQQKRKGSQRKPLAATGFFVSALISWDVTTTTTSVQGFPSSFSSARRRRAVTRSRDVRYARGTLHHVVASTALFNSNNNETDDTAESESTLESIMTSKSASSSLFMDEGAADGVPKFGDVVSLKKPSSDVSNSDSSSFFATPSETTSSISSSTTANGDSSSNIADDKQTLVERRKRNVTVAILSVVLAVLNYAWQWTHPVTPIQLLVNMEKNSVPVTEIGRNHKPTVMDFWAPWCENCKYMAPTLYQVEEQYRDKVNFVMVNGDDPNNWGLIEKLGVDAIPHMAMIEADGTVDTALIGPVPREWLTSNLDVMIENASSGESGSIKECKQEEPSVQQQADGTVASSSSVLCVEKDVGKKPLPYNMLDVFANRPNDRKLEGATLAKEDGR